MRDPYLASVLPFLLSELAQRGAEEPAPCDCPPGVWLGLNNDEASDDPDFIIIIDTLSDIMSERPDVLDAGPAGFDEDQFELTEEGQEELERQENRAEVEHLGKIIDSMVNIVGLYTVMVQEKVEG
jgi:hypothetical protein